MSDTFAMRPGTDLTGRVAVITGAAHGLGLALALYAADRGMMVALADANENLLGVALEHVKTKGVEAIAVPADMLDFASLRELARRCAAELGPPWLICNNPGVSIEVTLWGVVNGVQVFAPGMVARDDGYIVNIAAAEMFGTRCAAADAAITHAITGLSESLYRELDSMGSQVGVTLVCPAPGDTNIASASEYQNSVPPSPRHVPLNSRPPEEVAEQIFAAVVARHFWFCAHTPDRASRARTANTAESQIQRPGKRSEAARKEERHCRFGVARHVTHLWKYQ